MQFLKIDSSTTLYDLSERVGFRNVDNVLNLNSLQRTPDIGAEFGRKVEDIVQRIPIVSFQKKKSILNTFTSDADIFESVALQDDDGWKLLDSVGTMPQYIRIPETITIQDSIDVLGGTGIPISKNVYDKSMKYLTNNTNIDPIIFNEYSSRDGAVMTDSYISGNAIQWFNLPWGKITLHSSLNDKSIDFPVYPEGFSDSKSANYDTMPDMLYQYEPWYTYKGSGPRTIPFDFNIHRDMWSGDHRDGKASELIRFCEANCFPRYNGAAVQTPIVTLYLAGEKCISGIMTNCKTDWDKDSPIGLDGMYLHFTLSITITEISEEPLNYDSIQLKGLIG